MKGKLELLINGKITAERDIDYISENAFAVIKNRQITEWKTEFLNYLSSDVKWEIALKIQSK